MRSRFGGDGGEDFAPFLGCLARLGFKLLQQDASNRMFVVWVLRKQPGGNGGGGGEPHAVSAAIAWPALKACAYKKR